MDRGCWQQPIHRKPYSGSCPSYSRRCRVPIPGAGACKVGPRPLSISCVTQQLALLSYYSPPLFDTILLLSSTISVQVINCGGQWFLRFNLQLGPERTYSTFHNVRRTLHASTGALRPWWQLRRVHNEIRLGHDSSSVSLPPFSG